MGEDARCSRDVGKSSDLANERSSLHHSERNQPVCRLDDNTNLARHKQVGGIARFTLADQAGAILDRYDCTGIKKCFEILLGQLPQQGVRDCEVQKMCSITQSERHFAIGKTTIWSVEEPF